MGVLNLLPLGEPDRFDVEAAAVLYLEYDRKGILSDDRAAAFAMSVEDYQAVFDRAQALKAEEQAAAGA